MDKKKLCALPIDEMLAATASKDPVPGGEGIGAKTAASAEARLDKLSREADG